MTTAGSTYTQSARPTGRSGNGTVLTGVAQNHQLLITLDGPAISETGVPVDSLLSAVGGIQAAVRLLVEHLSGKSGEGRPLSWFDQQSRLRLAEITSGSCVLDLLPDQPDDPRPTADHLGRRALAEIGTWNGSTDSNLPEAVVRLIQGIPRRLGANTRLWLGTAETPRLVEVEPTEHSEDDHGEPEDVLLYGWVNEVNWESRTALLYEIPGRILPSIPIRLSFDRSLDHDMLKAATRHATVRGRGSFDHQGEWESVEVKSVEPTRSWNEPFDLDKFLNSPDAKVFDPEKHVTIDLTDEEWEAFDRAIRRGRNA